MLRTACKACRTLLSSGSADEAVGSVAVQFAACSLLKALTQNSGILGQPQGRRGAATGAAAAAAADAIAIDASAVKRLKELQAESPGKSVMLRVEVEGGGCSGFQYKFRLDDSRADEDLVFERDGVAVVCDAVSLDFLRGAVVEYEDSLMRSAFQIASNPNSESTCGCGSSFVAKM